MCEKFDDGAQPTWSSKSDETVATGLMGTNSCANVSGLADASHKQIYLKEKKEDERAAAISILDLSHVSVGSRRLCPRGVQHMRYNPTDERWGSRSAPHVHTHMYDKRSPSNLV